MLKLRESYLWFAASGGADHDVDERRRLCVGQTLLQCHTETLASSHVVTLASECAHHLFIASIGQQCHWWQTSDKYDPSQNLSSFLFIINLLNKQERRTIYLRAGSLSDCSCTKKSCSIPELMPQLLMTIIITGNLYLMHKQQLTCVSFHSVTAQHSTHSIRLLTLGTRASKRVALTQVGH